MIFDLNAWSLVKVSRALTPLLLKTPKWEIVNNISVAPYVAPPVTGVYNASKAAAHSVTENLRIELKPLWVSIYCYNNSCRPKHIENNVQKKQLPEDSIYRVVPEGLKTMSEANFESMDTDIWVSLVVEIYRGRRRRIKCRGEAVHDLCDMDLCFLMGLLIVQF